MPRELTASMGRDSTPLGVPGGAIGRALGLAFALWVGAAPAAEAPVAQVAEVQGVVRVVTVDGHQRLVAPGSTLVPGDTVVTEDASVGVLAFTDGTKMALRPATRLTIEQYHFDYAEPKRDSFFMRLLTGGLRTITGAIGKRGDRNAYQLHAANATIGIRGTEYLARLCGADCDKATEGKGASDARGVVAQAAPVARVSALKGSGTLIDSAGRPRTAALNAPVYVGDRVESGADSYVGLTFADDTHLVLPRRSAIRVEGYSYNALRPEDNSSAFQLLQGALRAATGFIGKFRPSAVSYRTPAATIGIRGTKFETACVAHNAPNGTPNGTPNDTPNDAPNSAAQEPAAQDTTDCNQKLLAHVREGRIALSTDGGSVEIAAGQSGSADGSAAPSVGDTPLPSTDDAPVPESLPSASTLALGQMSGPGLFSHVYDGAIAIQVDGQTIIVNAGQSAYSDNGSAPAFLLAAGPDALVNDPFLRTVNFDAISCTLP